MDISQIVCALSLTPEPLKWYILCFICKNDWSCLSFVLVFVGVKREGASLGPAIDFVTEAHPPPKKKYATRRIRECVQGGTRRIWNSF